jgi:hypothetical protein
VVCHLFTAKGGRQCLSIVPKLFVAITVGIAFYIGSIDEKALIYLIFGELGASYLSVHMFLSKTSERNFIIFRTGRLY